MKEWITVCQSSACLYRAIPAVDVWIREPDIRYYLCAECSIALGARLKALHYTWSKLEPKDAAEAALAKEYEDGRSGLESHTHLHRPAGTGRGEQTTASDTDGR